MIDDHELNEALSLLMWASSEEVRHAEAEAARSDIIKVVMAWRRGQLLPRREAPVLYAFDEGQ